MGALLDNLAPLLQGLLTTLWMAALSAVGALVLGVVVTAMRVSPIPVLRGVAFAYVQLFLNIPLLALLVLFVFALPDAGLLMPLPMTAVVVLVIYEAAYVAEAVRSGVNTVALGQAEAARALGLTFRQTLGSVILPQALRAVVQPVGNVMIALVMNTSLFAAVGIVELTSAANKTNLVHAQPIPIFVGAGLTYMALALLIGLGTGWLERRVAILR
ncbi:amino acid ABC transporter permease [Actinophytocola algeriensis]|jgi:glutamate transport system permease protein|uniref:Glutamate transport system permease protein n=1 Tax=Actinophytocola algeriensis TaxID=1768010 RepID=A0A7W7Q2F7_9PSEU|nr:amino acid ABC transporter permease [Actinophytocola algeriensis]MBB4905583.1 glutamate transport system permease protein [Actinophytocola algeriensis]MBE1472732.1 glutamate transport system permease protein [Actinophytocola algeriensis]